MKDLMIDLETLDTTATCVIVSIGAVPFDLDRGVILDGAFYCVLDVNNQPGRTTSESTLKWWSEQSAEARAVFDAPDQITLPEGLERLRTFVGQHQPRVWSNGANFDQPILTNAFAQHGIREPWPFWGSRCVRTYAGLPGADRVPRVKPSVAHNALADAEAQAQWVINIHKALFGAKR